MIGRMLPIRMGRAFADQHGLRDAQRRTPAIHHRDVAPWMPNVGIRVDLDEVESVGGIVPLAGEANPAAADGHKRARLLVDPFGYGADKLAKRPERERLLETPASLSA